MLKTANSPEERKEKPRAGIIKMLQVLAQFPEGRSDTQLRTMAVIPKQKTFETYKSEMIGKFGYAEYRSGLNFITDAGMQFLGDDIPGRPRTTEEMLAMWCRLFRAGVGTILTRIVEAEGAGVELSEFIGEKMSEKTVLTSASELKSNGLAEIDGSRIRASDVFFE